MMKKKLAILLCLLLSLLLAAPVAAAAPHLVDDAGYLTEAEAAVLEIRLDEISTRQGLDVVIVTVPGLYGADIGAYADDFYDENGYGDDGILLLISDQDRQWAISTTGFGITAFTDAGQEYLVEQFIDDLSGGDYARAFRTFAEVSDDMITQAKAGSPYDRDSLPKEPFNLSGSLVIALALGLGAGLITTGVMRSQLKSVREQTDAAHYAKPGSMRITQSRELYLYRHVSRTRRETKSSSGGSSTHRSSSGRTHGGSRGSF